MRLRALFMQGIFYCLQKGDDVGTMKKRCLIISGGDECRIPEEWRDAGCVIACDRGYLYAERAGIRPDLIIGDFDSAPRPETDIPIEQVPSRKDDTDTMIAARHAAGFGCREAAIVCCFGGRLDHTLANIQTAAFLAERGATVRLFGEDTEGTVFTGGTQCFTRRDGWSLSLFSLGDRCEGISIRGTKYDCEDITLTNRFPQGVSNVWTAGEAEVSLRTGILLVIQSRMKEGEHI